MTNKNLNPGLNLKFKIQHSKFIISFLFFATIINGQSTIDNVLDKISKNNKTIQAQAQYYEVQKMQYKTGNLPPDPRIEYDFLSGSPANAGNQQEFSIVQQLDFPTTYIKKSQLAKVQTGQTEFQLTATRQTILLEAKLHCIELIYQNKLQTQLTAQKQNIEKIQSNLQTKLNKGEGNILDLNKAKLQLIEIRKEFQENISNINQLNQKLTELNGGIEITLPDTVYPTLPIIPEFGQLENEYESVDPLLKSLQQQKRISEKQLELSKAMWLPKLELGYHYQGILGQTYHGIHTGISLPLWENKNTVKHKEAQLLYTDLELQAHLNEHYYHIKHIYEKYTNLKITLAEYQNIFATLNNTPLLNKALEFGEINTIQYFMEMDYYAQAQIHFLKTEKEYYQVIAELYKYKL